MGHLGCDGAAGCSFSIVLKCLSLAHITAPLAMRIAGSSLTVSRLAAASSVSIAVAIGLINLAVGVSVVGASNAKAHCAGHRPV